MNMRDLNRLQPRSESLLSSLLLIVVSLILSQPGAAQGAGEALEEVVVTGYRSSIIAAREAKRNSDSISDSIMAEDIGKSTDENIAEALRRITGITIQSSDGIGSTVTVRGLDPNLNLISMNGVVLGSADDGRTVDLSAFSADMLSQIEVLKTANASHNEGSLGGAVNLTTARPLNRKWERTTGELQWRSTDFDGEDDYKLSLGLTKKFADDTFGVAATIVQDNQFRRSDRFQTFDWRIDSYMDPTSLQTGQTIPGRVYGAQPRFSTQRIDAIDRENTTANVVLQYRPSDEVDVYLDLSYSNLDIVNDRYQFQTKNWHSNNPTNPNSGPGRAIPGTAILDEDSQTFVFSQSQRVAGFMQTRRNVEERETITATLGGSLLKGPWTIDGRISRMELNGDIPIWNQVNFQGVAGSTPNDPPVGFSCGVEIDPTTNDPTPGGTQVGSTDTCAILFGGWFNPLDPDYAENVGPRLSQVRVNGRQVDDVATSAFLDFSYDLDNNNIGDLVSTLTSIDFGFKYSDQSKDRFQQNVGISRSGTEVDPGAIPVGQLSSPFPFSDGWLGDQAAPGQATSWIVPDLNASFAALWPSGIPGTTPNPIQTWDVSEEVTALYLMGNFENASGKLQGNVGVRYVDTQVESNGTSGFTFRDVRPTYFNLQDSDCTSIAGNVCFVEAPVASKKDYQELLPSLNLTYLATDDMMVRFALTKTMARPTFSNVRPSGNLNIPSSGGGASPTFSGGNTQLDPLISNNIDLSWEWYMGDSNLISAAIFYKEMKDFVFTSTTLRQFENPVDPPGGFILDESQGLDPNTNQFPVADVISTLPVNGAGAEIFGIELSYQQTFENLPGFLSGLGLVANYTYADSEADYTDAVGADDPYEGFPFLNTSENSVNTTVFWENDRASVRLAYNWRDEYLVSPADLQMSTWAEPVSSLDASFNFQLTDSISLTGSAVNLTDESTRWYQTISFVNANQTGVTPEGNALKGSVYDSRTSDINYFGRTYRFGVRVSFD